MKKSILLTLLLALSFTVSATETKLMVRAKAKDAKFIGSSIGGAYVIVRNSTNNKILAEGITTGSTGNTDLIMKTPIGRNTQLTDDKTAGFLAVVDIDEPTFVRVEVLSPYNKKNAQVHASTELWLIPGKDILGDGVVVEIPGFIIDILTPNTHQYISKQSIGNGLDIRANMVMMCGCPIEKGGTWDSTPMEVVAILKKDGTTLATIPLNNPSRNVFEGRMEIAEAGYYEVTVYAYDPTTGNTGVDKVNYVVTD
ncbi:hypothetical protein SAMN04487891_107109 [Flagellimonas taeanensis]|uniref:Uncharacterized protein n=1 Tax=Flagellimonas taeanensis TaxID=1005926 RepID=A0A1M6V537_9FLAO|nr:hypothetical protein [Allomuricauda taeanensis]SFC20555.1 hypothetical protein SAMN04487891_107109 [Allomuricauda taeanensis]SHK76514.1 hypothetical protein SAMN05216293_1897 [Allomuricauda taeanensis]